MFDIGVSKVKLSGGPLVFYEDYTTTNLYVERAFGTECYAITVTNDSLTDTVSLSWNGSRLIADMKPNETLELSVIGHTSIYVKGATGGGHVRIWGT